MSYIRCIVAEHSPPPVFLRFFGMRSSAAKLAMLFIRACDAALLRSARASFLRFRSLILFMIVCARMYERMRGNARATTYLLLFAQAARPGDQIALALLLLPPLLGELLLPFPFFLLLRPLTRIVASLHEPLLALLLQAVFVQLQRGISV